MPQYPHITRAETLADAQCNDDLKNASLTAGVFVEKERSILLGCFSGINALVRSQPYSRPFQKLLSAHGGQMADRLPYSITKSIKRQLSLPV